MKKVVIISEKHLTDDFIKRFIKWNYTPTTYDIKDKRKIKKDTDLLIFQPTKYFCNKYPCISHLKNGVIITNNCYH